MCSLRFEDNVLTIEGVRFASISKKTPLSKLSFAFVSLALLLLDNNTAVSSTFFVCAAHQFPPLNVREGGLDTTPSPRKTVPLKLSTVGYLVQIDPNRTLSK